MYVRIEAESRVTISEAQEHHGVSGNQKSDRIHILLKKEPSCPLELDFWPPKYGRSLFLVIMLLSPEGIV